MRRDKPLIRPKFRGADLETSRIRRSREAEPHVLHIASYMWKIALPQKVTLASQAALGRWLREMGYPSMLSCGLVPLLSKLGKQIQDTGAGGRW